MYIKNKKRHEWKWFLFKLLCQYTELY